MEELLVPAEKGLAAPATQYVTETVNGLLKQRADDAGAFAGAVLLIARGGHVMLHRAYGHAELFDVKLQRLAMPRTMRADTVVDLASVTKAVATAMAAAVLFERGSVRPTDPVARFLPAFRRPGKSAITVADLLGHTSGLARWLPLYAFVDDAADAVSLIAELPTLFERGHERAYSDMNFVVLGRVLETAADEALDTFTARNIFGPLGMEHTCYNPPAEWRRDTAATSIGNRMEASMCAERTFPLPLPRSPTELPGWRRHVLVGEVNDANCHLVMGGVSGHAGLFSTASDLAVLARALMETLRTGTRYLLDARTVQYFVTPKVTPGQGLGWWCNRLDASPRTFGHRGFVGNELFIDPANDVVVVLLTNRVHSALPYADPQESTTAILSAVYRALGIAPRVVVDPATANP